MRDISTEFRLKKTDKNSLKLTEVFSHRSKHDYKNIDFPFVLKKNQSIKITDGENGVVYDKNWNVIRKFSLGKTKTTIH